MNERIKTMWEESTGSMWPRPGKFTAGEYDTHLEKFAELIVRECVSKIGDEYKDASDDVMDSWDRGFLRGLYCAMEKIKEHFGVEE